MFRAFVLSCVCFGITLGELSGNDEFSREPACENVHPGDIHMDLSNAGLTTIGTSIASNPMITCLNLAGNQISTLASNAFDDLPELSYLNLARSVIPPCNLTLPKLRTLILDETSMNFGGDNDGPKMSSMPEFSLPQLEKLSLRKFSMGKQDFIALWLNVLNIPNLTHLYLSGNKLTHDVDDGVQHTIFSKMQNLTHCYLDNNRIRKLNGSAMPNVRHLSANRNEILLLGIMSDYAAMTHSFVTRGMNNLEYLSLTDNQIMKIEADAFESTANLRTLNLARNLIRHFPTNASVFLGNLEDLTLDYNYFSEIPDVCALKELRSLSLVGNEIVSINATSFCGLQKLSAIYLGRNNLTTINNRTFASIPALRVLDLSWNKIVSLPENWIAPPNFIVKLHLDGNKFEDIESMALTGFDGLQYLSIGHNPIKNMEIMSLMNLQNSTEVDLTRDPLPPRQLVYKYSDD